MEINVRIFIEISLMRFFVITIDIFCYAFIDVFKFIYSHNNYYEEKRLYDNCFFVRDSNLLRIPEKNIFQRSFDLISTKNRLLTEIPSND